MSKGSKKRPGDEEAYRNNYDAIFGKKGPEAEVEDDDEPVVQEVVPQWVRDCWERQEKAKKKQ